MTMGGGEQAVATRVPIAVGEVDLNAPIDSVATHADDGASFASARLVVRLHHRPLGIVELDPAEGCTPSHVAAAVWAQLGDRINEHLRADGLPGLQSLDVSGIEAGGEPACQARVRAVLSEAPRATVAVCTRNRPDVLGRALESIERLDYPDFDIMVVDGSPGDESADIVRGSFPNVRYHRLSGGGLIVGRNRAIELCSSDIIVYTDDDAVVDRRWLAEHVAAFDDAGKVACTTGLAVPYEITTPSQLLFEEYGAFVEGYDPRSISMATRDAESLVPYATGKIGAGVSMAWRLSVLREIGGFDYSLDTCGAEDLAAFFEALVAGYTISFAPGALVHHQHRTTYAELSRQVHNHSMGLGAYLTRCLVKHPELAADFARRVPRGVRYGFGSDSIRHRRKSVEFPAELTDLQKRGFAKGPWAYVKGRRRAKQLAALRHPD